MCQWHHGGAHWCDSEDDDDLAGLLTLWGAKTSTRTRITTAISEQLFEWTIQKWRLRFDECPSLALKAKAGTLGALARPAQEKRARQQRAMDLRRLHARAHIAAGTSAPAATASQTIKLASVVDQADDREVHLLVQAHVDSAYLVYKGRMGDYQRPLENVSLEQRGGRQGTAWGCRQHPFH